MKAIYIFKNIENCTVFPFSNKNIGRLKSAVMVGLLLKFQLAKI